MAELNFLLQILPGNVAHIVGQNRIKAHLILLIIVHQGVTHLKENSRAMKKDRTDIKG